MAVPLERIINMKNQGYDDNTIISNLQQEGYSFSEILDGINQANIKMGITQPNNANAQPTQPGLSNQITQNQGISQSQVAMTPTSRQSIGPIGSMGGTQGEMLSPSQLQQDSLRETITSIVEPIIEEKWEEFLKDLTTIGEWKDKTESRINKIEEKIKSLQESFKSLHDSILERIGKYDQHMVDITAELKAIEMVFQKSLPVLSENINELSKIVEKLKSKE